jgi:hypothetical protein
LSSSEAKALLSLHASDKFTALELTDNSGKVLYRALGNLKDAPLAPGFYYIRVITPETKVEEQLLELLPGDIKELSLNDVNTSLEGLHKDIALNLPFKKGDASYLQNVGSLVSVKLSTLLLVARRRFKYRRNYLYVFDKVKHLSQKIRLKLSGYYPINWRIQILFVSQSKDMDYLSKVRLKLVRQGIMPGDDHEAFANLDPLIESGEIKGIAQRQYRKTTSLMNVHYWLWMYLPDQTPIVFNLTTLKNRSTTLIFHREVDKFIHVHQYIPTIKPIFKERDEQDNLRMVELLQRFYLNGRMDFAYYISEKIIKYYEKNSNFFLIDPITVPLLFYIWLKVDGNAKDLYNLISKYVQEYQEISDGHVILGQFYHIMGNRTLAKEAFEKALSKGLPIISESIKLLSDAISEYAIVHSHSEILNEAYERRIRGMLWSGWTPMSQIYEKIWYKYSKPLHTFLQTFGLHLLTNPTTDVYVGSIYKKDPSKSRAKLIGDITNFITPPIKLPESTKGLESTINFKYESSVSSIAKYISNLISNFGSSINTNEEQILEATFDEVEFEELAQNVIVAQLADKEINTSSFLYNPDSEYYLVTKVVKSSSLRVKMKASINPQTILEEKQLHPKVVGNNEIMLTYDAEKPVVFAVHLVKIRFVKDGSKIIDMKPLSQDELVI